MRSLIKYGFGAALCFCAASSGGCTPVRETAVLDPLPLTEITVLESAEGIASYYGKRFHGRRTASGERYDNNRLTAAHRTYPFGSWLRVTSHRTGKSVIVRVNDRGPRLKSRLLDLSYAAAGELEMLRSGLARVTVEVLDWGADPVAQQR
jgi:rare lipoprotein A